LSLEGDLNSAQREAVEHEEGPMVVLAGPGTGKTRVLTHRVVRLIDKRLVSPHGVLAVTFTRKAAAEMRERVQLLLGYDVGELNISTIHSLAYRILSVSTQRKYLPILDASDAFKVLKRAVLEVGLDDRLWDRTNLFREIQQAKGRLVGPDEYVQVSGSYFEEHVARVYRRYQQLLEEDEKLDMSDLVLKAVRLLDKSPGLLAHLRALSPFILVDEFQDTSMGQYELLKRLAEERRNLFVVVSPAQGLYEWRGAYADRLLGAVRNDFNELREVTLRRNYRSSGVIVGASKAVINGNGRYPDIDLKPVRNQGSRIVISRLSSPGAAAAFVVARSSELHRTGTRWSDIAVLYRTHRQAHVLEKHLTDADIPYASQNKLYQRPEVQQVLAYLRLAYDPHESGPLDVIINVPPRGIGPNSLRRMKQGDVHLTVEHLSQTLALGMDWGMRNQVVEEVCVLLELVGSTLPEHADRPPADLIRFVLRKVGLTEWLQEEFDGHRRLAGIRQVQRDAAEFTDLPDFLDYARRRTDDFLSSNRGVQLSTIHAAKGLEFNVVFVVGLEEGTLPHAKALKRAQDPAEERRLCYVAMTRARDRLFMLCSRAKGSNGRFRSREPSRYFGDLPRELVKQVR
jgi:DNA helicase-2/ATP-dependent DNA helicase PcrA